jgi:hypothetical protein
VIYLVFDVGLKRKEKEMLEMLREVLHEVLGLPGLHL